MRTIDGRSYAEDEDARRLEKVILDTVGLPVKLRVVDGRFEIVNEDENAARWRFFSQHSSSYFENKPLIVWMQDNLLRFGSLESAIDHVMARA